MELEMLLEQLKDCRHCQEDFGFEPRPVQWGHPHAPIMHISQAPSRKVHEIGRPFSDLSGKRLRQDWYQISDETFYDMDKFYITTVGHCFPGKSKNGRYDAKPPKCCYDMWTKKEIELKQDTKLYLVVGKEAADRIFPKQNFSQLVFQDLDINGVPAFVLPHPSPLNTKWLRDHPQFEQERLPVIRQAIKEALNEY
jgi:uracil-DNA glycosylase family 4